MKRSGSLLWLSLLLLPFCGVAQNYQSEIKALQGELQSLKQQETVILEKIEGFKLKDAHEDLMQHGLPAVHAEDEVIKHECMALVYSERHEQAKWVAHVIMPDIVDGKESRTNDFRPDPLVKTGTAVESDYFLKKQLESGDFEYDGFGYDRGHLAPSADFRWSKTALSESYFYSNMSPQLPEFNREGWADLEATIRGYIFRNPGVRLYVTTGPVLHDNLPHIERGMNKVSIPEKFYKVVMDLENKRGIGFVMPHEKLTSGLDKYAMTIREVEALTGHDFFSDVEDPVEEMVESKKDITLWLPEESLGDVDPIHPPSLPPRHFNTKQAKLYMDRNEKVRICGTVVGARTSRKGNILLNLDKKYPNQVFTVFVRKEEIVNFSYDPEEYWKGKTVVVHGQVANLGGTPAMFIEKEDQIGLFTPRK